MKKSHTLIPEAASKIKIPINKGKRRPSSVKKTNKGKEILNSKRE